MLLNLNKVQLTLEAKKQEGIKEQENPRNPDAVAKEERVEVELVVICNNK